MPTAIVLSGGGAHGDFEVGALQYLYAIGIRPNIVCGTSVGSINGAKIAEGEGDPTQGLQGLVAIWQSLQFNQDMYQEEPWLADLPSFLHDALIGKSTGDMSGLLSDPVDRLRWGDIGTLIDTVYFDLLGMAAGLYAAVDQNQIKKSINDLLTARAVYNLGPINRRLTGDATQPRQLFPDKVAQSGIKLRLAVVSLETGQLRYVTETGVLLERDNKTSVQQVTVLDPACQPIANTIAQLESDREIASADLPNAAGSGRAGLAAQIKQLSAQISQANAQLQACMAVHPSQQVPLSVNLVSGVMASATMPAYFPPVLMGTDNYVDGGVRAILPLQAAIDLGADTIYAIVASKIGTDRQPSFNTSNIATILYRSLVDITLDEIVLNDAYPPGGTGPRTVKVIAPLSNLHDILTIDPGLIAISMAYGYMRAADVVTGGPQPQDQARVVQLADSISQSRQAAWKLEREMFGGLVPLPPPGTFPQVRAIKRQIRSLVNERGTKRGVLPPGSDSWWRSWEKHPFVPHTPGPWPTAFAPNQDWTHGAFYGSRGTYFADVDGDGRADALAVGDATVTVRRSTGTDFGASGAANEDWTHGAYYGSRGTFFADVDGDGRADAIVVNDGTVTVRRSSGHDFGPNEDWTHGAFYGSRATFFADVDGDGRADAIAINDGTITVRRSTGHDFGPTEDWTHGAFYGSRGTFFADVDGDGRADAIAVNDGTVTVRRSTGHDFGASGAANEDWTHGAYYGSRATFFADLDADGLVDAIVVNDGTVTVRRSTGHDFGPTEDWTHGAFYGTRGTFFADVDGSGSADAVAVNDGTITVRLSS